MWLTLLSAVALSQGLDQHHVPVAGSSLATEGGPGALWVNPANLAYDQDARYGAFFQQQTTPGAPRSAAVTAGVQGLSFGLQSLIFEDSSNPDGSNLRSDWSLDYGTSIALPQRLAVGLLMSWNFIENDANYLSYDAASSWRPLPWFGLSVVAQNVGSPDPSGFARPRTAAGIALRPFGDALLLGLEGAHTFVPPERVGVAGFVERNSGGGALRIRAKEGLFVRADGMADIDLDTGSVTLDRVGLGLEVFFDGVGGGYHHGLNRGNQTVFSGFFGTDEPGESLWRPKHRVPKLDLTRTPAYEPRASFLSLAPGPSWFDILELLRRAEEDRGVQGVTLNLSGIALSWPQWEELRDRISRLEDAGKPVVVYLDGSPGNGAYFAATAASSVYLHPAGNLNLIGFSAELQNLRGLLDMVGVQPQFVRRSEYKSSPESYVRNEPSTAALEMTNAYLDDRYGQLLGGIKDRTDASDSQVRSWVDEGPWTPLQALEAGLVDGVIYPDQLSTQLSQIYGADILSVDLLDAPQPHSPWEDPAKIALIYIDGVIVDGESSSGGLLGGKRSGADTVVRALRQAQLDPTVRAVVLRVDSPGGSSFASDEIWHAIERIKDDDIPVVVSMGGLAASGGYYVSAGADAIFAEPGTLTGSIGVYSGKFSTSELFENVGIEMTALTRGRNSNLYSSSQPWDDVQRAKMEDLVAETYTQFKTVVSDGRGLTMEEVEEVARGRVWTGQRAAEIGLVDELGGLQDAIADARERAGLPESRKVGVVSYSHGGTLLESLAPSLVGRVLGPLSEPLARSLSPVVPTDDAQAIVDLLPISEASWVHALYPNTQIWMMNPWLENKTSR